MSNRLILGDNLEILKGIESSSVDLCYIDPPFFSNRNYEVIWGDEGEVASFKDRWSGGIEHYINWLYERVVEIHRVLKDTGSIYLHCDYHANTYIAVNILDKIFGRDNFRADLVWKRANAHNDARKKFPTLTDTIWYYSKSSKYTFHQTYTGLSEKYIDDFYRYSDKNGMFQLADLSYPKPGGYTYEYKGYKPHANGWRCPIETMRKWDAEGLIYFPKRIDQRLRRKRYLKNSKGTVIGNIWTDIKNVQGKERIGYPTQKPVALLERIIKASSNEGDVVLDCFCGGGTTISVAKKLNRRFIGIDQSVQAIKITQARLEKETDLLNNAPFTIETHKYDYDMVRESEAFEFERFIIEQFGGEANIKQRGDYGIDGIKKEDNTNVPIQTKRSDNIGRNVIDNFKSAIARYYKSINKNIEPNTISGYIIAFSFGKGAVEEVARLKREENIVIKLMEVEDIIPIAKKPKIEIGYEWEEVKTKTDSLSKCTDKRIIFKIKTEDSSKIELYQWDFNYNKDKGFKATILRDIKGTQEKTFEGGKYNIAVRAVDVDGLECIEELRIIVNGGVKET